MSDPYSVLQLSVASEKLNTAAALLGRANIRLSGLSCTGPEHHILRLKDRKLRCVTHIGRECKIC